MNVAAPAHGSVWGEGPWATHRMALAFAAKGDLELGSGAWGVRGFPLAGPDAGQFLDFLVWHGLAGVWLRACERQGLMTQMAPGMAEQLVNVDRAARVLHMAQGHAIRQLGAALDAQTIPFAVLKGVAIRDEIYATPHVRPATDVDLLIRPQDRQHTGELLSALGFVHTGDRSSAHEETWQRGSVDLDLHWDVLAPGRTRRPMVEDLLARRMRSGPLWRLGDEDTVALMLLHPAVTKYVCSPHVGLNRVVDFLLFVRARPIDWDQVVAVIRDAGLTAGAWCMLSWIDMLADSSIPRKWPEVPDEFRRQLQPGPLKSAYLRSWLKRDLPGRLVGRADWLVRIAFTLAFHDRLPDAWRAIRHRSMRIRPAGPDS